MDEQEKVAEKKIKEERQAVEQREDTKRESFRAQPKLGRKKIMVWSSWKNKWVPVREFNRTKFEKAYRRVLKELDSPSLRELQETHPYTLGKVCEAIWEIAILKGRKYK